MSTILSSVSQVNIVRRTVTFVVAENVDRGKGKIKYWERKEISERILVRTCGQMTISSESYKCACRC